VYFLEDKIEDDCCWMMIDEVDECMIDEEKVMGSRSLKYIFAIILRLRDTS
jgi:hypothetical protein